jgi:competence protein ComEC
MTTVPDAGVRAVARSWMSRTDAIDLRLAPAAVIGWAVSWLLPLGRWPTVAVTAALAALSLYALRLRAEAPRLSRALALAAVAGVSIGLVTIVEVRAVHGGPMTALAAEAAVVTVQVRIAGDPVLRESRVDPSARYLLIQAKAVEVTGRGRSYVLSVPVLLTADTRWSAVRPGERYRAMGRLTPTAPTDDIAAVVAVRGPPLRLAPAGALGRLAERLRAGLREACSGLPADASALIPALVVGDVSRVTPDLAASFKSTGLTHLSAVSGTNLAILLAVVLAVARPMGVRGTASLILGVLTVGFFVVLARPQPSVLRAAVMGLVVVVGVARGFRRGGVPALAIATVLLLLADPFLARSFGFGLSVLATAALLLIAPTFAAAMSSWAGEVWAAAVSIPLAATLVTLPLILVLSGSVSLAALPANLLVEPAVAPVTVIGVLTIVVAAASPPAGAVVAWLAAAPASWIAFVARHGARAPGAAVPAAALDPFAGGQAAASTSSGEVRPAEVVAATVLCVVLVALSVPVLRRRRLTLAVAGSLALVLVAGPWFVVRPVGKLAAIVGGWPPGDWRIAACDVGQGDGLVLRAAAGSAVVVDTGPDPLPMRRCLDLLGIRRVPLLILTHFHADHIGGISGVLARRQVGLAMVTRQTDLDPAARRALDVLGRARVPVRVAVVGERLQIGDVAWQTLWAAGPTVVEDHSSGDGSAENDKSIVGLATVGDVRMLATGDVEPAVQSRLEQAVGAGLAVDVLKVPHHGSRYQDPDFLALSQARVALISVGADNDYGHPATQTIGRLTSSGTTVLRTDLSGTVLVTGDREHLRVVSRVSAKASGPRGPPRIDSSRPSVTGTAGPLRLS